MSDKLLNAVRELAQKAHPLMIDAMRRQKQCDEDGSECIVSRQACDEAVAILTELLALADRAEMDEAARIGNAVLARELPAVSDRAEAESQREGREFSDAFVRSMCRSLWTDHDQANFNSMREWLQEASAEDRATPSHPQREGQQGRQPFDETPPCAYVPIHPRTGPLWANVAPTTDSESFPKHYQVRALFMQQLTCPDGGTCHHHCKSPCARRDALGCVPLTVSGLNDDWTPPETRT